MLFGIVLYLECKNLLIMKNQDNNKPKSDDSSDCLSASELVHRHLQDQDHEISESDLQKVSLDCNDEPLTVNKNDVQIPDATSISMNKGEEVEQKDGEKEKDTIITPLDVIS